MARYYKSRFMAEPVVYIQEEGSWCSYGPWDEVRVAEGDIPEQIMKYVAGITETEADDLIAYQKAKREGRVPRVPPLPDGSSVSAPRGTTATGPRYVAPRQPGMAQRSIGGYLVFVIIWIGLTMIGGLSVLGTTAEFAQQGVPTAVAGTSLSGYGGAWTAIIIIDFLGALALLAVPILIFVFMGQRRRSTRWLMIGYCSFAVVLAVLDLVLATTFGIDSLRAAGLPAGAEILINEQVASMFGAMIGLLFVLPYLLGSQRVKDTFAGRPAVAAMPFPGPPGAPASGWPAVPFPSMPGPSWPSAGPPQWAPLAPEETTDGAPRAPDLFCPRCGAARVADARFCIGCGREFGPA